MMLRGCPVPAELVNLLAYIVDDPALTWKLERALALELRALKVDDRDVGTILEAIEDDPPEGLEELRGRLLTERSRGGPSSA
jgi:hypothetical protein